MTKKLVLLPMSTGLDEDSFRFLGDVLAREFGYDTIQLHDPVRVSPVTNDFFRFVNPFDLENNSGDILDVRPEFKEFFPEGLYALHEMGKKYSDALLSFIGKHGSGNDTLAVTDFLYGGGPFGAFGQGIADERSLHNPGKFRNALVSTALYRVNASKMLGWLAKSAVHEIGHLHKIFHHDTKKPNGKYCPMTCGTGLTSYHIHDPRNYDLSDSVLCETCKEAVAGQ